MIIFICSVNQTVVLNKTYLASQARCRELKKSPGKRLSWEGRGQRVSGCFPEGEGGGTQESQCSPGEGSRGMAPDRGS